MKVDEELTHHEKDNISNHKFVKKDAFSASVVMQVDST